MVVLGSREHTGERGSGVWEGEMDAGQRHGLGCDSKGGEERGRTWEQGRNAASGFGSQANRERVVVGGGG